MIFRTGIFPDIGDGLFWDTSNLLIDGTVTVIPEPGNYALLFGMIGMGMVCLRRSNR